jgi:hypothetical protein
MQPDKTAEHAWLGRLVGKWQCVSECLMGPDQPPTEGKGSEEVRSLGGLWTIGEGEMDTPGGEPMRSIMTLGYDPGRGRFVGTFIASCMTHLWVYDGELVEGGQALELHAQGPAMTGAGMASYIDRIEFESDDTRVLSSRIRMEDGSWVTFMTARYTRVA